MPRRRTISKPMMAAAAVPAITPTAIPASVSGTRYLMVNPTP
jgi:hypothetical protein